MDLSNYLHENNSIQLTDDHAPTLHQPTRQSPALNDDYLYLQLSNQLQTSIAQPHHTVIISTPPVNNPPINRSNNTQGVSIHQHSQNVFQELMGLIQNRSSSLSQGHSNSELPVTSDPFSSQNQVSLNPSTFSIPFQVLQSINASNIAWQPSPNQLSSFQKLITDTHAAVSTVQTIIDSSYSQCQQELQSNFWKLLYSKLLQYQKLSISSYIFQIVFFICTFYYSFKNFDISIPGSRLILMYILKNILYIYFTKKHLSAVKIHIDDYTGLQSRLSYIQSNFSIYANKFGIIKAKLSASLLQIQEAQSCVEYITSFERDFEEINKIIKEFQSRMKDSDICINISQIYQLKNHLWQFKRQFMPIEQFESQQNFKHALAKVREAVLKESSGMIYFQSSLNLFTVLLSVLTAITLATTEVDEIQRSFLIVLIMNLVHDNIQGMALAAIVAAFASIFLVIFGYQHASRFFQKIYHRRRLNAQINSLKRHKFNVSQEAKECSICLSDYQEDESIITLNCDSKHVFHNDCILAWIKLKNECPLCRSKIFN